MFAINGDNNEFDPYHWEPTPSPGGRASITAA